MTSNLKNQLLEIADTHGTPTYVYHQEQIVHNYQEFKMAFDVDRLKIHYACKALSNTHILKIFLGLGAGLDCVSEEEVLLGLRAGFLPEDIIFTPNFVGFDEIERVINYGCKVTLDNISVLEKFGILFPEKEVFIRINPHLMAGGNQNISVGHIDSKFGISIHQFLHVKRIIQSLNINVNGIHVHTGSDILDEDVFVRVAELIFNIADELGSVTNIDLGSGFKVAYKKDDLSTNIQKLGKKFSDFYNDYRVRTGKELTLRFEPGKYMVSNAGYFITKVNSLKQTTSCTFAGVNSGFNHLIRPMFYQAYHEIINLSNPFGEPKLYNIVGYICETDTFAQNRLIPEIREGDVLCFKNAGAYSYTMSSNYNARLRPAEVLIEGNTHRLIRKREKLEDLIQNEV